MAAAATVTVAFGSTPVAEGTFTIVDAGVSAASYVEAFIQSNDSTSDNDAEQHRIAGFSLRLTCAADTGQFVLDCVCLVGLVSGDIKVRYVYSP